MSIFNGKFRRRGGLDGQVNDRTPRLRVSITPKMPRASITPQRLGISVAWAGAKKAFAGSARMLRVIYRFISARTSIHMANRVEATTAPTVAASVDKRESTGENVTVTARPVQEMKISRGVRLANLVRAVAHLRADFLYRGGVRMANRVEVETVPGVPIKRAERLQMAHRAEAEAAPAKVVESRYNKIGTGSFVDPVVASTQETAISRGIVTGTRAEAEAAPSRAVNIGAAIGTGCRVAPYTWLFPEQDGNLLTLPQVFSGVQSGDVLEVDTEETSVYWANNFITDGALELVFAETATPNGTILEVS